MTRRSTAVLLSAALLAGLLFAGGPYAGTAYACSCAGSSGVAEELRASDAVFAGEALRGGVEDPEPEDGAMYGGMEFRVDESWKGVPGDSAVIYGQSPTYYGELETGDLVTLNSCSYTFEEGKSYLVYASRYEDGFLVGVCSGTTPLAGAGEDLRILGPSSEQLTDTGGPVTPPRLATAAAVSLAAAVAALLVAVRRD